MNMQQYDADALERPVFHSNAYAKAAQGGNIGATSAESFSQRRFVNRNRQTVRHYGASMIGRGDPREQAQLAASKPGQERPRPIASRPGSSVRPLSPPKPTGFREPPARGYNPYS